LATIDLGFLVTGMIVFVDKTGDYLIVEGEELILGSESEQCFSNFYYSQIESTDEVELANFKNGMKYLSESDGNASIDYTSDVMESMMRQEDLTQYTTVYDLQELKVRVYLFHDYTNFVEFTLDEKIQEGNHQVMIADLFPKDSPGYANYLNYNDPKNPTGFLKNLIGEESLTEEEFEEMGFSWMVNTIGYEWLSDKEDSEGAVEIFKFGTELMPNNANLFDSLGEAYFTNEDYEKSKLAYEQSLTLNPENEGAKVKLEELSQLQKK
jgi:tetratricopeptide (TPR) repeat protein